MLEQVFERFGFNDSVSDPSMGFDVPRLDHSYHGLDCAVGRSRRRTVYLFRAGTVAGSLIYCVSKKVSASGIDHHVQMAQETWTWTWTLRWTAVAMYQKAVPGHDRTCRPHVHLDRAGRHQMVGGLVHLGDHGRGVEVAGRSWRLVLQ